MDAFAALADETRRGIVDALAKRERSVGEIVDLFSLSQPTISQHLRVLRDAKIVAVGVDKQRRIYRLNPSGLKDVDRWLQRYRRFWSQKLDALERHLDENP